MALHGALLCAVMTAVLLGATTAQPGFDFGPSGEVVAKAPLPAHGWQIMRRLTLDL